MKQILVGKDKYAIVDDKNYNKLKDYKWYFHNGYAQRQDYSKRHGYYIFMHWDIIGKPPKGLLMDHLNGNRLDNQRNNLRICTYSQNSLNRHTPDGKPILIEGKGWHKKRKRFQAQIYMNGKKKHLGFFKSEIEAKNIYESYFKKKIEMLQNLII